MRVTVAVCTWNRAPLLRRTLASLAAQGLPPDVALEIVVVDNGSSDETPEVLREHARGLPLRALREPAAGVSHARNRAVAEVRGEWILWLDDDTVALPGWLAGYAAAIRRHPEASFFGGATLPWTEQPPPAWIAACWDQLADVWAIRTPPDAPAPITRARLPVGANFAIRAEAQRRHAFDPRLGHSRGSLTGGEETAVVRALLAEGDSGWWVPDAQVRHWIPVERMTERHLRGVWYGNGRERALLRRGAPRSRLRLLARALRAEARYRVARRSRDPARWLRALERAQGRWGELGAPGS